MSSTLIESALAGDETAFEQLVGPFRHELQVHCYRILGSLSDAEDAVQETLTAAWLGLPGFEQTAPIRSWLYRIATNRCLNMLRSSRRRPRVVTPPLDYVAPEPTRAGDVLWLEPYPDALLHEQWDINVGPEARYEARESISLAFIAALQLLPARQRVVMILRDVMGFTSNEVADLLDSTEQSISSALKRARATLAVKRPDPDESRELNCSAEHKLLSQLVQAFESGDVKGIVALLTDDVWVRMPPGPMEYQGREMARTFFTAVAFRRGRRYRLLPSRANGQPAFGVYLQDPNSHIAQANGLLVITLKGNSISAITKFNVATMSRFELPQCLGEDAMISGTNSKLSG